MMANTQIFLSKEKQIGEQNDADASIKRTLVRALKEALSVLEEISLGQCEGLVSGVLYASQDQTEAARAGLLRIENSIASAKFALQKADPQDGRESFTHEFGADDFSEVEGRRISKLMSDITLYTRLSAGCASLVGGPQAMEVIARKIDAQIDMLTTGRRPCRNFRDMGSHSCSDRTLCSEPCGDLGVGRFVRILPFQNQA